MYNTLEKPGTPERKQQADDALVSLLGVAEESGFTKADMVDAMARLLFDLRERILDTESDTDNGMAGDS